MKKLLIICLFLFSTVALAAHHHGHRHHHRHHHHTKHYGYGYTNFYFVPGNVTYQTRHREYYPRVYYRPYRGDVAYYYYGHTHYRHRNAY